MFDKSKDNFLSFEFCLILSLPLLASKVYLCGRNSRLSINRRVCPLEINVMKSLKKANIYFIQNYLLSNALILFLIFTFQNWKTSENLKLVPLRTLICSYQCFNLRGPDQFGIARVQSSEKLIQSLRGVALSALHRVRLCPNYDLMLCLSQYIKPEEEKQFLLNIPI